MTALENIDALKARLKADRSAFTNYEEEVREIYDAIFALRLTVNSERGKKSSLEVKPEKEEYEKNLKTIKESKTMQAFVKSKGLQGMNALMASGHGGEAEDAFRMYVLKQPALTVDVPRRYMPTANARIEVLQNTLNDYPAKSEQALSLYSEIFRTRRAVKAVHGEKDRLKANIDPDYLMHVPHIENSETFKKFVAEKGDALKSMIRKGHGGEAELMFKEHVLNLDRIPSDIQKEYMPTALERTETLQKKIKSADFTRMGEDQRADLYAELLSARDCVGAVRGKKDSLKYGMDPLAAGNWTKYWGRSKTFKDFLRLNPGEARKAALTGHGGELEDKLYNYVLHQDAIRNDVPDKYIPTALKRTEALQYRIKHADFDGYSLEKQTMLYAELMATRTATGAQRGKKDSLDKKLDPAAVENWRESMKNSKTLKDFVASNPDAVRKAALSGHGGALDDMFKEYVKNLDRIPEDVPQEYMPNALQRTEVLQKKIKAEADAGKRIGLYKELMATREAVGSVRGDKKSLDTQIDRKNFAKARKNTDKETIDNFLKSTPDAELAGAARSGHGGELDDKFRKYVTQKTIQNGLTPKYVSERFRPDTGEVLEGTRRSLKTTIKGQPDEFFTEKKDGIKQRVASVMYYQRVNDQMFGKEKLDAISHDKVLDGVRQIVNDQKFNNMFDKLGPRYAAELVANNDIPTLFQEYAEAPGAQRQEPVQEQQNVVQQQPARQDERQAGIH